MSKKTTEEHPPVLVRGVVTLLSEGLVSRSGIPSSFCIEDDTGGLWVSVGKSMSEGVYQQDVAVLSTLFVGAEVEIESLVGEGSFAPVSLPKEITILGSRTLSPPIKSNVERFVRGGEYLKRVIVQGVVQDVTMEPNYGWLLKVETGLGHFLTRLPISESYKPEILLDAEIQVTGMAAASRNWRGEFVCPRIIISREEDVRITKKAPQDPFATPYIELNALDGYSPQGRPLHRVRVQGIVTYKNDRNRLFIQEDDCAVRVDVVTPDKLELGDRVEVAGFIDKSDHVAGLGGAIVRVLAKGYSCKPQVTDFAGVQDEFDRLLRGERTRLKGYDGLLTTISGKVLSHQFSVAGGAASRIELACTDSVSTVYIQQGMETLLPGSTIEATGIAQYQFANELQTANYTRPTRLDLLATDGTSIHVYERPSWWTLQRLGFALAGVVFVSIAITTWAASLRFALLAKTTQLANEMAKRRDASIEFQAALKERTRLAANLHDTVLQTVTGVAYQLQACQSSLEGNAVNAEHLETAKRMIQRGQADLRSSVWALRALPLQDESFGKSVQKIADQWRLNKSLNIKVHCGEDLPQLADYVAGNLLLIIQESINNAIKHAEATQIDVLAKCSSDGKSVTVSIEDNGKGFEVGQQPSQDEGHFGIQGMRERTERLSGKIHFESKLDSGTKITLTVPLHDFDNSLI
jgi:signal transduction histidine kinase